MKNAQGSIPITAGVRRVLKRPANAFNDVGFQFGKIGQSTFHNLVTFPHAFTQQDSGRRGAVGYGFDVHGMSIAQIKHLSNDKA